MPIIQQLIQLLTQSPDSVIYHVIVLLALQAIFGLALWQYRRDSSDVIAWRLALASAGLFVVRLAFALVVLWLGNDGNFVAVIPPIESALEGISVALVVWALIPVPANKRRLANVTLFLALVLIGFMYVTLANQWSQEVRAGESIGGYVNSDQAELWDVLQMVLLGIGGIVIILARPQAWGFRLTLLAILIVAHLMNTLSVFDLTPTVANSSFWIRLGNLIAYPVLAAFVYQHNIGQLLPDTFAKRTTPTNSIKQLKLARGLLQSAGKIESTLKKSLAIVNHFYDLPFAALAVRSEADPNHLIVQSSGKQAPHGSTDHVGEQQTWAIKLSDWPAIKLALQQRKQVELLPDGLGARQLHNFYQEMNVSESGALLIEPLLTEDDGHGVMLLAKPNDQKNWSAEERALSVALSGFLAQAIVNTSRYGDSYDVDLSLDHATLHEEIRAAKVERDKAKGEVNALTQQLQAAQEELEAENKKVIELRTIIDKADPTTNEKIKALEQKVFTLGDSLSNAEHALALVAAGETGLSVDWVMQTVSRYSGELEDAQAQINHLETKLTWRQQAEAYYLMSRRVRELRTPLTSLSGYTEILLSESAGELEAQQSALLMRMKTNIEQIVTKLDLIARTADQATRVDPPKQRLEVRETIEAAVNGVSNQLRNKRLRLDLNVASNLSPIPSEGDAFYQIVSHLLNNACQVSEADGKLGVTVWQDSIQEHDPDGKQRSSRFLHLAVSDSGGSRSQEIHSLITGMRQRTGKQGKQDWLSVSRHSLATATALVVAQGGRTWVEPNEDLGSTFSILLPIPSNGLTDEV